MLNNVVTFLDDYGRAEARRADAEIAAGKYKGPLHGIPWGAKDIISVKGYKTTWGSAPFKDQVFDYDASVVEMLRDAGAVLIAKLTTGELAAGDNWFGGQTKSPWDPTQGSSGSSAGPASATAAGCVGFAHRHRDERIDPESRRALRAGRTASHVRAHQPLRRDGAVVDAGSPRADVPLRRRLRDRHAGDRQAGRPRHERVAICRSTGTRGRRAASSASATSRSRSTSITNASRRPTRKRCSTCCGPWVCGNSSR